MDRYDLHIQEVTSRLERGANRVSIWAESENLFKMIGHSGSCLTMVKDGEAFHVKRLYPELTHIIDDVLMDPNIPSDPHDIKVENLPAFAEYQRQIDAIIGEDFEDEGDEDSDLVESINSIDNVSEDN